MSSPRWTPPANGYARVYRRYLTAEIILAAVVVAAIFTMAVQPG